MTSVTFWARSLNGYCKTLYLAYLSNPDHTNQSRLSISLASVWLEWAELTIAGQVAWTAEPWGAICYCRITRPILTITRTLAHISLLLVCSRVWKEHSHTSAVELDRKVWRWCMFEQGIRTCFFFALCAQLENTNFFIHLPVLLHTFGDLPRLLIIIYLDCHDIYNKGH